MKMQHKRRVAVLITDIFKSRGNPLFLKESDGQVIALHENSKVRSAYLSSVRIGMRSQNE